ncbi:MAG: hypothetical protein HF976_08625 [ANME-2 cluster archaeon]|nr:hypothetical protein [ANME-2 cluster archaeon]
MSTKMNKLVLLSALMIAIIGTFGTVSAEEFNLTADGGDAMTSDGDDAMGADGDDAITADGAEVEVTNDAELFGGWASV